MENWQLETGERLASIERSIKYIEDNIKNLPPSSHCIEQHKDLDRRLEEIESFRNFILQRIAWVSGAFAVLTSGLVFAIDYIKDHIFIR